MRDIDRIGWVGVVSVLLAFLFVLLTGCATAPPACRKLPTAYEQCADYCASQELGIPLLWENVSDRSCFCRKSPEGT